MGFQQSPALPLSQQSFKGQSNSPSISDLSHCATGQGGEDIVFRGKNTGFFWKKLAEPTLREMRKGNRSLIKFALW